MQVRREHYVYDLGGATDLAITELVPEVDDGGRKAFRERAEHDVTGWTVWGSAVVLARYLLEYGAPMLAGAQVLELGAGCGLSGLAAAQRCSPAHVWLTDFNAATVENLAANAAANAASCAPLRCSRMDWDAPETWPRHDGDGGDSPTCMFDVVIGADLVYRRSYARKLVGVLSELLRPHGAFVCATPGQRDGLQTLQRALEGAGWTCEAELDAPPDWRTSPLRPAAGQTAEEALMHFPELAMKSMAYELKVFVFRKPAAE